MLQKKEKKSYGVFEDNFLSECAILDSLEMCTHLHIYTSEIGIPKGIYRYDPGNESLSINDYPVGIISRGQVWSANKSRKLVMLHNPKTWQQLTEDGLVNGYDEKAEELLNVIKTAASKTIIKKSPTVSSTVSLIKKKLGINVTKKEKI